MDLADILDISRTSLFIDLESTVTTTDNSLSTRYPRVIVAEDTCILFISRWIRGDFSKFYMVFGVRRL